MKKTDCSVNINPLLRGDTHARVHHCHWRRLHGAGKSEARLAAAKYKDLAAPRNRNQPDPAGRGDNGGRHLGEVVLSEVRVPSV